MRDNRANVISELALHQGLVRIAGASRYLIMTASLHSRTRRPRRRGSYRTLSEQRERMIRETNAFFAWALKMERRGQALPRIPRLRVDQGGFIDIVSTAGGRAMIRYWWKQNVWDKRWRFC